MPGKSGSSGTTTKDSIYKRNNNTGSQRLPPSAERERDEKGTRGILGAIITTNLSFMK